MRQVGFARPRRVARPPLRANGLSQNPGGEPKTRRQPSANARIALRNQE
jgi:hypothetical protein